MGTDVGVGCKATMVVRAGADVGPDSVDVDPISQARSRRGIATRTNRSSKKDNALGELNIWRRPFVVGMVALAEDTRILGETGKGA